ncbi:MAG: hypothetical protein J6T55_03155 [Alphaproteobacteria bacterium]|nr:hypothetical protein [Alphaproteobacteria bacterium]
MNQNESGRSMTEMLGVLAIMGIIIYGSVTGINSGLTSYRINQAYSDIHETISSIKDTYLTVYGRNTYPKSIDCNYQEFMKDMSAGDPLPACKTINEFVKSANSVPPECGSNHSSNNSKNCFSLFKNDIQFRGMTINATNKPCDVNSCTEAEATCSNFEINYATPNEDFCTRLKEMDWGLLSIEVSGRCEENLNLCFYSTYKKSP